MVQPHKNRFRGAQAILHQQVLIVGQANRMHCGGVDDLPRDLSDYCVRRQIFRRKKLQLVLDIAVGVL